MTEIEIRGKLTKSDFERLTTFLSENGKLTDHYHRLSVDLSPGFDEVTKTWKNSSGTDIRLKKSDSKEKLSVKSGNFHDQKRKEVEVKLETGQFLSALDFLESLGYKSGMVYCWESWEYEYRETEVKLSRYTDDYHTFEIEGKENSGVNLIAKNLKLVPYTKDDYRKAIDWENQNIHRLYNKETVKKILL